MQNDLSISPYGRLAAALNRRENRTETVPNGDPERPPDTAIEAKARTLWKDARTPELRAHLRLIYPNLFEHVKDPKPRQAPVEKRPSDPEREAKANAARARIKGNFPDEFADGERCGLFQKFEGSREPGGYPKGFHQWPIPRRNAWWAGYNLGRSERFEKLGGSQ
jgi:hypothetical protein